MRTSSYRSISRIKLSRRLRAGRGWSLSAGNGRTGAIARDQRWRENASSWWMMAWPQGLPCVLQSPLCGDRNRPEPWLQFHWPHPISSKFSAARPMKWFAWRPRAVLGNRSMVRGISSDLRRRGARAAGQDLGDRRCAAARFTQIQTASCRWRFHVVAERGGESMNT